MIERESIMVVNGLTYMEKSVGPRTFEFVGSNAKQLFAKEAYRIRALRYDKDDWKTESVNPLSIRRRCTKIE